MARNFPSTRVAGLDLNDKALKLAELNASLAGVHVDFACSDLYSSLPDLLDGTDVEVIISNPPYIASSTSISGSVPIYSDGGASLGLDVSIRIVKEGSQFLARGGILLLYTGVTILAKSPGQDPFLEWVKSRKEYELLDYRIYHPDMWPEEIGKGVYADAARIQVVGIVLQKQ
ncbi:hypothetical protein QQS21_002049 [Conoideocrella luteorostrata]|uniref:Methyltransferase small domain-containing protein n=1 Tax=Conoideocrella luteorostrata TaxID=1105319 RepID=A0AAJ0CWU2_9HYPO|nr:hypothetical protein QQS21_002049 [Conoideocrella luteorostrata]